MSTQKEIPVIFIEGGIGSGKSTLVKELQLYCNNNNLKILTVQEPVDSWVNIKNNEGINIIEAFYADQHKHSFSFQMLAYISRLQLLQESYFKALKENYDFIVCERSLYTDKNVFCKMLYDEGKIDEYGYQIYNKWFEYFQSFLTNFHFVYLKTDYTICFERVNKRNRNGEENIPLEYLEKNNSYHDNWLNSIDNILFLDGNEDLKTNPEILRIHIMKIIHYLNEISL